jgi:hypothetical protein
LSENGSSRISTELLFPWAGDSVWELIERGGSYGAPLALMLLTRVGGLRARPEPRQDPFRTAP